ncbi:MAG: S41 family peptidase [Peptoniphilaceae bacterium]
MNTKNKRKILIALLVVVSIILFSFLLLRYLKNKSETIINMTYEEKVEDFNYLLETLDTSYPFWSEIEEDGIEKEKIYEEYKSIISKTNTDIEFMKEIGYFLKEFNGYGHLSVLDGYVYKQFEEIFNLSQNKILDEEEKSQLQPWYNVLYNPTSEATYNLLDSSHSGFRSKKGLKEEYVESQDNSNNEKENNNNVKLEIIDNDKIAYINIGRYGLNYMENDSRKLNDFLVDIKQYPNLIIDIRDNGGGSDKYWKELIVSPNLSKERSYERYFIFKKSEITKPFLESRFNEGEIKAISNFPQSLEINSKKSSYSHYVLDTQKIQPKYDEKLFQGKIWILTSENVYSASENFAMFSKNTDFATLVGTNTGGDGGVADPILINLPNSGLIVRFSMFYGLNLDGTGNEKYGTTPDILVDEKEDALERTLEEINEQLSHLQICD